jgi:hypothetical protein
MVWKMTLSGRGNTMKFKVHIYAIVRVPVDIEADDPIVAAKKADEGTDLHSEFQRGEYAEAIDEFFVDHLDDNGALVMSTLLDAEFKPKA